MSINVEDYQHYVGKMYAPTSEAFDRALKSGVPREKVIGDQDLPLSYRILEPNSFTTLDFNPYRVNLKVDEKKVVKQVSLG